MLVPTSALAVSLSVAALSSSSSPGTALVERSPAALAAARGDFAGVRSLPSWTLEEALFLEANAALAEHRLDDAAALADELERLPGEAPAAKRDALEVRWRIAHARDDVAAIARTAAALCDAGDATGRACADAELWSRSGPRRSVTLAARTVIGLSPTAPLPALAVELAGDALPVAAGAILDTGASQTVISSALAQRLGLSCTSATFPVGVAAGGAVVQARLALLPVLVVGGVTTRALPVLVLDLPDLERVGISVVLSPQQAFDGLQVVLDFQRRRLTVEEPADDAEGDPYFAVGFDLAVRARVGEGPEALFGLDTGMDGSLALSSRYPGAPRTNGDVVVVQGAGGAAAATAAVAPLAVRIGGQEVAATGQCIVSEMPGGRPIEIAGLLGNGLWRGGRLVLNTRARRVSFSTGG